MVTDHPWEYKTTGVSLNLLSKSKFKDIWGVCTSRQVKSKVSEDGDLQVPGFPELGDATLSFHIGI